MMKLSTGFAAWLLFFKGIIYVVHSGVVLDKQIVHLATTGENAKHDVVNQRIDSFGNYLANRSMLINSELESSFGSDIKLNENEQLANKIIMKLKEDELAIGRIDSYRFIPSRHIFEVLDQIKESKLFQIIQKMPKGGILHAHESALCTTDYIVSLTYWPDLWQFAPNETLKIERFLFSRDHPSAPKDDNDWRLVKDVRAEVGISHYDSIIRSMFSLYDRNVGPKQFKDANEVWKRFGQFFIAIARILSYKPVRKMFFRHALENMLKDGVQYLEFRAGLGKVVDFFSIYFKIESSNHLMYLSIDFFY